MSLLLTEEQESIQRVAHGFVRAKMPASHFRALRAANDAEGFSRAAWKEMAALGLAGVTVPEMWGGAGLGLAELGIVLEECGRCLAPTPILSTMVLGAGILLAAGSDAQRAEHLPAACAGERLLTLAHDEGTRHIRHRVVTRAERTPSGWRLRGQKTMVLDGHVADAFFVVARSDGKDDARDGLVVCTIPRGAPGLGVERLHLVDHRNTAAITLDDVFVPDGAVVGEPGRGADVIDPVLDRAALALSAEMFGGASEAFEQTLAYLKTRKQFGVAIGSFQALKHRAAQLFCELEMLRTLVLEGLRAADAGRADVPMLAAAAKAVASETFVRVANEAIQMHGGIGVTDELDVGFFLK